MKRVLISIFLCFYSIILYAQMDTIYYRYDDEIGTVNRSNYYSVKSVLNDSVVNVKEYYRFTNPHTMKAHYTEDVSGNRQGAYATYAKDGYIREEGTYLDGEKNGLINFYRDGGLQRSVPYLNGKREGMATYFYKGKKIYTWTWKDGKSDGDNTSTYEDGTIRFKGSYVNSKREGVSYDYNKKGNLISMYTYKGGVFHGPSEMYHDNGQLFASGAYHEGSEFGAWKWYRKDGTLASEELYSKTGRLKKITFYDASGEIMKSRKRDKLIGVIDDKKKLHKRIQKHMNKEYNFPELMRRLGYEARVFLSFKIDKNGDVIDVKANSDAHPSFDLEAQNLIKSLPKQESAYAHNVLIEPSFAFPLAFRIMD